MYLNAIFIKCGKDRCKGDEKLGKREFSMDEGLQGRSQDRNARSNLIMRVLEGERGWTRDPHGVKIGPEWARRFPNLPFIADGRECTGFTRAGRGTTAFDMFRSFEAADPNAGGAKYIVRSDFLSIKTANIAADNKLPSKVELSTGNRTTLDAILEGVNAGASIPTLFFASGNLPDGSPDPWGLAIFLDLGEVLRKGVTPVEEYPEGGYRKGQAPLAYMKWSSPRACGGKRARQGRDHLEFPYIDSSGNMWDDSSHVRYPELVCSLSQFGITRESWWNIHVSDLPMYLEDQLWEPMARMFDDNVIIG